MEYEFYTDEEADQKAKEYILDSVWAFNPDFLIGHGVPLSEKQIRKLQEDCEDANEGLKALIKDLDYFVEDAIACDGRGHFISSYDGEEYDAHDIDPETYPESGKVFAYRID